MVSKRSFLQNYMTTFPQIVPPFAARFSGVLAEVEAPCDQSGNQDEVYQIRNGLLSGLLSMPNMLFNEPNVGPVYTYFII